ncbi:MAG: HIT family protein [Pseudomonadota bacterium]
MNCIFCDIINNLSPCHKIWEDQEHLSFLSIFPNTKGFSVVVPKRHLTSYAFEQSDDELSKLVLASKKVARILDGFFADVGRTGMILEGYGVDHLHSKLFPMHGTGESSKFRPISSNIDKYFEFYEGYISSHDCKREDDKNLSELAECIRKYQAY